MTTSMKPHTKSKTREGKRNATPYSSLTSPSYHRHVCTRYRVWPSFCTKPEIKNEAMAFQQQDPQVTFLIDPSMTPIVRKARSKAPGITAQELNAHHNSSNGRHCLFVLTVNQHEGDRPSSWACVPTLKSGTLTSQTVFFIYTLTVNVAS